MYQVAWITNKKLLLTHGKQRLLFYGSKPCVSVHVFLFGSNCVCCTQTCVCLCEIQILLRSLERSVRQLRLMYVRQCYRETVEYCVWVCENQRWIKSEGKPKTTIKQEEGGVTVHQRRTQACCSLSLMALCCFSTSLQRSFHHVHTL